ncbi:MAG: TonB-dependent receptor [Bacteroidales bacterium]|jgi:TonB-linked SusC/RagA family outer membrane protein|nr:TonB-dependent receptor [Bacteroidales bacterium]
MKRFILLLLVVCFVGLVGTASAQKVTLSFQSVPLEQVLNEIKQQTGLSLVFSEPAVDISKKVSINVTDVDVQDALKNVLNGTNINFEIKGNKLYLMDGKQTGTTVNAENKKIFGVVVGSGGELITGANVVVKGSQTNGTVTDVQGRFNLEVPAGATTITVSFIGYKKQEINVAGGTTFNITLEEDHKLLDGVVVVGYGTMRKSDFTGSIASVRSDEMSITAPTAGQAIIGKISGVQVLQPSGAPGEGMKIRVRGVNSLSAGSTPLYVIDGFPASEDVYINPEDIESIEVLKDAASAAIYGSRGAGGVVMVTTKRGQSGKVRVDYDYQFSVAQLDRKIKLLDAYGLRDLVIDGRNNTYRDRLEQAGIEWNPLYAFDDNATRQQRGFKLSEVGISPLFFDFTTGKPAEPLYNTDWQDAIYSNAPMHRHNIAVTGGMDYLQYRFSVGYLNQDGILAPSNHKRLNVRANVDANVTKWLKIGTNFSFSNVQDRKVNADGWFNLNDGVTMAALVAYPVFPVYNEDGSYAVGNGVALNNDGSGGGYSPCENPVALANEIDIRQRESRMNFNTNIAATIIKGLTANANIGVQYTTRRYNYYRPPTIGQNNTPPNTPTNLTNYATDITNYDIDALGEFTLNYKKEIDKHRIDVVAGYTMQKKTYDRIGIDAFGFSNDFIHEISAHGPDPSDVALHGSDSRKAAWTMMSFLGRVNYVYGNRYALSATLRADGSSRFGPDNKWGLFPSVSAGWTISNEEWYKNAVGESTNLKLRASWGLSGNNNIGNYEAYQTMSQGGYPFGGTVYDAYWQGGFADPSIGWEKTSQANAGVDLSLFNNRLSLIGNYYYSVSYSLLYEQPISAISGSTSVTTNLTNAKVRNTGFDLQLDGRILTGKVKWNINANISLNRNMVLDMGGINDLYLVSERSTITHLTQAGLPIGSFYGYQSIGIVSHEDYLNILIDKNVWRNNGNAMPDGYTLLGPAVSNYNNIHEGDVKWEDANGDGKIDENDRKVLGGAYPDFSYGFSTEISYLGFDLRATFVGQYGAEAINFQKYYLFNMEGYANQLVTAEDRWRSTENPGDGEIWRAARTQDVNTIKLNSYMVEDASFFRCANITFGYSFPATMMQKIKVQRLRLYVSVDNAFTITKYSGYNPEVDFKDNNLLPGFDWGVYPLARTYSVGVKLTF